MSHYFQDNPSLVSNIKEINFEINNLKMKLFTDSGVFSKKHIDAGSFIFLKVLLPLDLGRDILDLGCGYGAIGLTLAMAQPKSKITLADINPRAVALCQRNVKHLKLSQRVTILQSDIYNNIEGQYDSIVVNPPIRAGKRVTYPMYAEAKQHLIDGGSLYIVIRKAQGALSAARYIEEVFGNVTLLKRHKGYHIYRATKSKNREKGAIT
ncbi:MAG: class I SAM-dependent methyltransferase [Erysipelotrichia bacterium]|nr:class I SAM-dependent methyltransferase [Erysipelotrichia bacterium]